MINLLDPREEDKFRVRPEELSQIVRTQRPEWIILDEVQKLPRLLDLVHLHIEEDKQKFILSGSSARKLKRGQANLLAGRAVVNHLHPFTSVELGKDFELTRALEWGLLPKIFELQDDEERAQFLESYCLTYLKEEIQTEQIVRRLDPFRAFIPIAAQMSGKIINFSKIAREVGVDTTTVQNYFSILEDTLLGFYLPAYHASVRKRQKLAPKFYIFDTGVTRALSNILDVKLKPQTSLFGVFFENFLITEIRKLADYAGAKWEFSYYSSGDQEIDLVLHKPMRKTILIEIKSTDQIQESDLEKFMRLSADFPNSKSYCFSLDPNPKKYEHVECMHWKKGLEILGL